MAPASFKDLPLDVKNLIVDQATRIPGVNFFVIKLWARDRSSIEICLADHLTPASRLHAIPTVGPSRFPPYGVSSHYGRLNLSITDKTTRYRMLGLDFKQQPYYPRDVHGNFTFISPDDLAYFKFTDDQWRVPGNPTLTLPKNDPLTEGLRLNNSSLRNIKKVAFEVPYELYNNCIWEDNGGILNVPPQQPLCITCGGATHDHLLAAIAAVLRMAPSLRAFPDLEKVYLVGRRNVWVDQAEDCRIPKEAWRYVAKGNKLLGEKAMGKSRWVRAVGEKFYLHAPNSILIENSGGQEYPFRSTIATRVIDHIQARYVEFGAILPLDQKLDQKTLLMNEEKRKTVEFRMMHWIDDSTEALAAQGVLNVKKKLKRKAED